MKEKNLISEETQQNLIFSLKGVGPITFEKLNLAGYTTIKDIAAATPRMLSSKCDFSEKYSQNLIAEAKKFTPSHFFEKASEILKRKKLSTRLTLGNKQLDDFLQGGIETQAITEFFGESATGKTQICFQIAAFLANKGGLGENLILYIDSENTFKPERVEEICIENNLDVEKVLNKILVIRAFNSSDQILVFDYLEKFEHKTKIKLIIIDSITTHFRSEFIGRGYLSERQQLLNSHLKDLMRFSIKTDSAIVLTNQVLSNPDTFGMPLKPAGGNILAHSSTIRIFLKKAFGGKKLAKIFSAPHLEEKELLFKISKQGVSSL